MIDESFHIQPWPKSCWGGNLTAKITYHNSFLNASVKKGTAAQKMGTFLMPSFAGIWKSLASDHINISETKYS